MSSAVSNYVFKLAEQAMEPIVIAAMVGSVTGLIAGVAGPLVAPWVHWV